MEISIFETQENLIYQIETMNSDYQKALLHNGYSKDGSCYRKVYPFQFPFKEKIKQNYKNNIEAIIKEEAGLTKMNWQDSLCNFASIAKKANINWWTTGGILLPLNGIDNNVGDLDFYFNTNDLDKVYEAFQDYIVEPIVSGHRAKTFKYHGLAFSQCTVCIFFEPNASIDIPEPTHFGPYAANHLETISWMGYDIKVPPIELYIKTLERWGKKERVINIKRALQRN